LPLVAPAGTVAVMVVALTNLKVVAAVPPKLTATPPLRPPLRLLPVSVTLVPTGPLLGLTEVRVGAYTVVFSSTPTVPSPALAVSRSSLPSPFTSATAMSEGLLLAPVLKVAVAPKKPIVPAPSFTLEHRSQVGRACHRRSRRPLLYRRAG
jgi:hypothetical protein